jgi:hypothetical protein
LTDRPTSPATPVNNRLSPTFSLRFEHCYVHRVLDSGTRVARR